MTTKQDARDYLSNLAKQFAAFRAADPIKVASSLGLGETLNVCPSNTGPMKEGREFSMGLVEWFLDGKLTKYHRTEVPYGERKNSKKRITTTFFFAERDGLRIQLGHADERNYQPGFWERGVLKMVNTALNIPGEFSYHSQAFLLHAISLGAVFEDLGEKK